MFDNKLAIIKLLFCFSVCFLTRPIWLIVLLDISTLSKQDKKSKQVSLTYPAGTKTFQKRCFNVSVNVSGTSFLESLSNIRSKR